MLKKSCIWWWTIVSQEKIGGGGRGRSSINFPVVGRCVPSLLSPRGCFYFFSGYFFFFWRIFFPLLLLMTFLEENNDFLVPAGEGDNILWLIWIPFLRSDLPRWSQEVKCVLNWIINVLSNWAQVLSELPWKFETDQNVALQHVFLKTLVLRNISWTKGSMVI